MLRIANKKIGWACVAFFGLIALSLWLHAPAHAADQAPAQPPDLGVEADFHGKIFFPPDDPWNTDISRAPVDPASDAIIKTIGLNKPLHPDFGTDYNGSPMGIPYVVVGKDQPKIVVKFQAYPDESDAGPYPVPKDAPVEGGLKSDGDRHVIVYDRDAQMIYELFRSFPTADGGWQADSGAIFDVTQKSAQRKPGETSADAAGLPILPGLVRYDEVVGLRKIEHALRFTVQKSRRAYVPPALHWASHSNDATLPPMGMRVRLKAGVDISAFPPDAQVILTALKKYGMIVADNGSNWYVSGTHDSRWDDDTLHTLTKIHGSDFEVIRMDGLVAEK